MSSSTPPEASVPETNTRLVLASVAIVILLASLGQTIVATALPVIVADLDGLEYITWVITAYLLAATVVSPIYGKLGDMFGRKIVLQTGIVLFLLGSAMAAFAPDMVFLVVARLVQGAGGGGLLVMAMTVVADVLPPRQRGKAQGLIGGTFGVSTVIGPLLGGLIVEQLSWRWIFLVNLPTGLVALVIIAMAFTVRPERVARKIDYLGAALLAAALSAIVLVTSLGGNAFAWISVPSMLLALVALASLAAFVFVEARAEEPIIPLYLFRNNVFAISNAVGFIIGLAMFGSVTFLPLFLQVAQGISPTASGLHLLPMMAGLIGTSTLAGFAMTRTGRYRMLPIVSTAVLCVGMLLMGTIDQHTSPYLIALYMFTVGVGIGPVMSVGITAIQNAIPMHVMGVGTASANMFRQIGGSIGVSLFGAIFSNRLAHELGGMATDNGIGGAFDAERMAALSEPAREALLSAFSAALHPVFWFGAAAAFVAFLISWRLEERPLSNTLNARAVGREDDDGTKLAAE